RQFVLPRRRTEQDPDPPPVVEGLGRQGQSRLTNLLSVEEDRSENGRGTELINSSPDIGLAGNAGANRNDDTVSAFSNDICIRALEHRRGVDDDVVVHVS